MPYDDGLAYRIRRILGDDPEIEEREMFGGIGFMIEGNMVCGVIEDALIARVGPDAYEDALADQHAREFDFTGRPMTGWVAVDYPGLTSDEALKSWIDRSVSFVESLPPK